MEDFLVLIHQHAWILPVAGLSLGLLVGSHLAVLSLSIVDRHDTRRMTRRSCCPSCGQALPAHALIPVLSWLWQAGQCRHCRSPISLRYPAMELLTATITLVVVWQSGWQIATAALLMLSWLLILMSWIDAEHLQLPDRLTLGALWLGLVCSLLPVTVAPAAAITGAAVGYVSLWSIYQLHRAITRREGMGYGDFKLFAAIGAWTGASALPGALVVAASLALLYAALRWAVRRAGHESPIPFGPFLAVAGWFAIVSEHGMMDTTII